MMNIHHAAKSVSISAFHVTAAPTINTIKHIGDKNMVYVSASSLKCDFIIQSPMTFFPHSPNCNELEDEACHHEVDLPTHGHRSPCKNPDDVHEPRTSAHLKAHNARKDEHQHHVTFLHEL